MILVAILWAIWLCALAYAVIVACRRPPASRKSAIKLAVVTFGLVSLVCVVVSANLLEWILSAAVGRSIEPLFIALSPLVGLLAALRVARGAGAPAPRAQRWLPVAMLAMAALWVFEDVQAAMFWWWRVDISGVPAALAKPTPIPGGADLLVGWALPTYLESWPTGPQAERARKLYEDALWHDVQYPTSPDDPRDQYSLSGRPVRFDAALKYLRTFPAGPRVRQVLAGLKDADEKNLEEVIAAAPASAIKGLVENRVYQILAARQTVGALLHYQQLYPGGKLTQQSNAAIDQLRHDTTIWKRAAQSSDVDAVRQFLVDYPAHQNAPDAQRRLDGTSLDQLVADKLIEVELGGCGITTVCGRIRRLTEYPLVVVVAAGTLFTPSNAGAQSMAITTPTKVPLDDSGWNDVTIDAVCADMWRDIPNGNVKFRYSASSQDRQLARLESALGAEGVEYPVLQAMVWIVRSNPSREQLRYHLTQGGGSVIEDEDIDEALRLLSSAGYKTEGRRAQRLR